MADKLPVDLMRPYTIKSVPSRIIERIGTEAPKMGLTAGQLVEKSIDKFFDGGGADQKVDVFAYVIKLIQAAGPFNADNPMPRDVRSLINAYARMAQGLPGRKPGQTNQPSLDDHTGSQTENDRSEERLTVTPGRKPGMTGRSKQGSGHTSAPHDAAAV